MSLYRVVTPLYRGKGTTIPLGQLTDLGWLTPEQQEKLVTVGAVAVVHAPPLTAFKNWEARAKRLKNLGIITLGDVVNADEAELVSELKVGVLAVRKWKAEARALLAPPPTEKC